MLPGDPAVDEQVILRQQDRGHSPQKGQFFGKLPFDGLPGGSKGLGVLHVHPGLMGHGDPGALFAPKGSVAGGDLIGPRPAEKAQGHVVAVALHEIHCMGVPQIHEIVQGLQSPR